MECFITYLKDIEGRIDPNPYHPLRINTILKLKSSPYDLVPLSQVAIFKRQLTESSTQHERYIGLENIESDTGILVQSSEEKESFGAAFRFTYGDVLFPKLRPYLNKVYLAEFNGVCSTEFHILQAIKCKAEYLFAYLNSKLVVNQTSCLMTGNTLPRLQTGDIEKILVPIPPPEIQNQISSIMQSAYQLKRQKEAEAQKLLNSIDEYVLGELGLELSDIFDNKTCVIDSSSIYHNRHDPYYFNPKFDRLLCDIEKGKFDLRPLRDVSLTIFNGHTPAREEYSEKGDTILKVGSLGNNRIEWSKLSYVSDEIELNKTVKDNDILILSSAHQADYVGKNPCIVSIPENLRDRNIYFVGELICIRTNNEIVNPYFLLAVLKLNAYYLLINREKRGQTSHLYPKDLGNILVPVPPLENQDNIATESKHRMDKADELMREAEIDVKKVKAEVERLILGNQRNPSSDS